MSMDTLLKPLRKRLTDERLIEADFDDIVKRLEEIHAQLSTKAQVTVDEVIEKVYGQKMGKPLIEELVTSEQRRLRIREEANKLNLDRMIIEFLKGNIFFMEVSRWIRKRRGDNWKGLPIPTAAMCYNLETDDFEMVCNFEFFAAFLVDHGEAEGTKMIQFILGHELYHFTLKHLTLRRRRPAFGWNIATDAANNSLLVAAGHTLPPSGIYPSRRWDSPPLVATLRSGKVQRKLTPEEEKMMEGLSELIEQWPTMQTSEWYFNSLMEWAQENGHQVTDKGIKAAGSPDALEEMFGDLDMHDLWDQIPEETRERVMERMKGIMREAVKKADNEQNGWGNIPADLQKSIRAFCDDRVDWETVLKQYVGSFNRGARKKSIKRINKKYPEIHPGHRRDHLPKILILMDQSGSVRDEDVALAFGVLGSLAKKISFTVAPFDTSVDENGVFEWKKGMAVPTVKRTRCGGTDFKSACEWANAPERRGKWDGVLVITDGECYDPGPSKMRRAWLIVPGHKLMFATNELVVSMDERGGTPKNGAIR